MRKLVQLARIIVTGGSGFIGTHVSRWFRRMNHEVLVVDRRPSNSPGQEDSNFALVDLQNEEKVRALLFEFKPNIIVHLAAVSTIPDCDASPVDAIRTNIIATEHLRRAASHDCRFIFASSGAVYCPNYAVCSEATPCAPIDVYGSSKLAAENLLRNWCKGQNVIARLFNVVGPGDENDHLVPSVLKQLIYGSDKVALGNTDTIRDYVHIEDVCRCIEILALHKLEYPNAVFNIGTGSGASIAEVISITERVIGRKLTIEHETSRKRERDRKALIANTTRFRQAFGWAPEISLEQSVRDAWRELNQRLS